MRRLTTILTLAFVLMLSACDTGGGFGAVWGAYLVVAGLLTFLVTSVLYVAFVQGKPQT